MNISNISPLQIFLIWHLLVSRAIAPTPNQSAEVYASSGEINDRTYRIAIERIHDGNRENWRRFFKDSATVAEKGGPFHNHYSGVRPITAGSIRRFKPAEAQNLVTSLQRIRSYETFYEVFRSNRTPVDPSALPEKLGDWVVYIKPGQVKGEKRFSFRGTDPLENYSAAYSTIIAAAIPNVKGVTFNPVYWLAHFDSLDVCQAGITEAVNLLRQFDREDIAQIYHLRRVLPAELTASSLEEKRQHLAKLSAIPVWSPPQEVPAPDKWVKGSLSKRRRPAQRA